jgi:hypothetical protein
VWNTTEGKQEMKCYLAGLDLGNIPHDEKMKLYLAGFGAEKNRANANKDLKQKINVLESFFYIKDWMLPYIHNEWDFLLDSGAFTFMQKTKTGANWGEYTDRYIEFINTHKIEKFFELDLDSVIGLKDTEKLRRKIEKGTGKKTIPVWHKSRGLDYWKWMTKSYPYVAIGGIVSGEIKKKDYPIFSVLLNIAKENGCKVHGLGLTGIEAIRKYRFYSVDSTAWIYGNISGFLYIFNGSGFDKVYVPKGKRVKSKKIAIHNFKEWVKFQKYAERHL